MPESWNKWRGGPEPEPSAALSCVIDGCEDIAHYMVPRKGKAGYDGYCPKHRRAAERAMRLYSLGRVANERV